MPAPPRASGRPGRSASRRRPAVRRRRPEHRVELLVKLARGRAVRAHAALFVDDVAFGVELAKHRIHQPIRFHPEPQLELVGGDVDEVDGEVLRGPGIHAARAGGGVDLVELVLDDEGSFPCSSLASSSSSCLCRRAILRILEIRDLARASTAGSAPAPLFGSQP